MRYADTRGVLRGLLSEMLMQRELLVVGFSLTECVATAARKGSTRSTRFENHQMREVS